MSPPGDHVRKAVIAGNWKMHMTCAQARAFAATFRPLIADLSDDREVVLAPPFTAIPTLCRHLAGAGVAIAGQNVHWEESGAYTGMISAPMLLEHGVTHAIVGHSEPRKYFSETDEQINLRARTAQKTGLIPILCVGESDDQREARETERVIHRQVEQGLEGVDPLRLIVAYEPIWAIGTGKTCAAEEANRICGLIRGWVGHPEVVVQYGGSVNPATIDMLMAQSDIDGVLVGGASLDPVSFARIANYQVPVPA
ncbi:MULTISPECIES: triose-phosphate isomerase [unclassified Cyanobium]|uniref:triose-phosphate isomerase n=1 Tax=unclassified Cyanobium TaxID=2627006 RepID=UPI0020CD3647|nr:MULTISPECIES: triose-phosphate isomerase [unclassified Cyanobium]MCP9834629.1 triose-phosphate isomerase [Cyanobium sp. La Preciosa 7G6]MCP9937510.1 triose-phosphate isomerase [Cyanobium sp. Aljojuca 7A6]